MWARALIGIVAGFFLAVILTGLICWLPPGPWQQALLPSLFAFFPLWMGAATAAFAFTSNRHAYLSLGGMALAGFMMLELLRNQAWVQ